MRYAPFLIVLAFAAVALLAGMTSADWTLIEDDFDLPDDSTLDPGEWAFGGPGSTQSVKDEELVVTARNDIGIFTHRTFWNARNFTVQVDFKTSSLKGEVFHVCIFTHANRGRYYYLTYEPNNQGWQLVHDTYELGGTITRQTFIKGVKKDLWYTARISFTPGLIHLRVVERSTGEENIDYRFSNNVPPLGLENKFKWGVDSTTTTFDNLFVTGIGNPTNHPPVWKSLPELDAVEEVPVEVDFSSAVSDADGDDLTIGAHSPYVIDVDDMNVTFNFPDGVLEWTVRIRACDGEFHVYAHLDFTIEPVNSPPSCIPPERVDAVEEVPVQVDLSTTISDPDNSLQDMSIVGEDPYVRVEGLTLNATFPEGVLAHTFHFNLSDGVDSVHYSIEFRVTPVDDPPLLDDLGTFEMFEDNASTFDLTPYVHDVDTPLDQLTITVDPPVCTVDGLLLGFLYTTGGHHLTLAVIVKSSPGNVATGHLDVTVWEVNDPPVFKGPQTFQVKEEEEKVLDLSPLLDDEETDAENLTVDSAHPAVRGIDGTTISVLFDVSMARQRINFTASDGKEEVAGWCFVNIEPVNDPPRVVGVDDLVPPITIEVYEGETVYHRLVVEDEDSDKFTYERESTWDGVTVFANGTLRISPLVDEVGEVLVDIVVRDGAGGEAEFTFAVRVLNVNGPPDMPVIVQPTPGTQLQEGIPVVLKVMVSDPDLGPGEELTVTWTSNVSGLLATVRGTGSLQSAPVDLPAGEHLINVTVSDGYLEASREIVVTVDAAEPEPPDEPDDGEKESPAFGALALLASMAGMALLSRRRRWR